VINTKDEEYLKAFGKHLRKLRKEKGFTQESLAYKADLSLSQIGRIERGEINPTLCTLKFIAENLELPLSVLVAFDK